MPYVPSKKTDGESTDREIIDKFVELQAKESAKKITNNFSVIKEYKRVFVEIANALHDLSEGKKVASNTSLNLAQAIFDVGGKYKYEGAFLGELNYAITRFIQRVPQIKVENDDWEQEIRYWLYGSTIEALIIASAETIDFKIGIGGIFEDIKDEYKRRVNIAYEAEQIVKSGDCYDAPYYTRLVEIVDESGEHVGYQEIMLKRDESTLNKDVLDGKFVLKK